MWIFCCGMHQSGSTVQYLLTKEIVESNGKGKAIGFLGKRQFGELYHQYGHQYENIVIKSHRFVPDAIPLFEKGEARAIYVYRDLRDTIVSAINKNNCKFNYFNISNSIKNKLKQYYQWQSVNHILVSRYEDMITDLQEEARRIGQHLGIDVSEDFASELAQKYSLEQQKKRIASFDYEKYGVKFKPNVYYDPETQLHNNHINSGKFEQWKTELSPLQVAFIEARAYDWLIAHGYPISQSWLKRKSMTVFMPIETSYLVLKRLLK